VLQSAIAEAEEELEIAQALFLKESASLARRVLFLEDGIDEAQKLHAEHAKQSATLRQAVVEAQADAQLHRRQTEIAVSWRQATTARAKALGCC